MSDRKRGARVTGGKRDDIHDDGPGKWWLAWFTLCAILGLGVLGVLAWAVIKAATSDAG